ncbi:cobalt ECF transporter T component CbiQ [Azonexus sp.]|uniref:cobalt ECF transporter T component CbiQ n=1 Tax=Azonexus sp. TaxID=1872668 RepID=UPI0039E44DBE
MLIERLAYGSRWRQVSPAAKALFALAALVAAYIAASPLTALCLAAILAATTCFAAGVSGAAYARVAAPALVFLLLSVLPLLWENDPSGGWRWSAQAQPQVVALLARAVAALAALLSLVLTTPLPDLLALLRRLRCPEALLDVMVLCYRMLFVFEQALRDTATAQRARLGYGGRSAARRALGALLANLVVQVWQRAEALHRAAQARASEGAWRFLAPYYAHARRDVLCAALAGSLLVGAVRWPL